MASELATELFREVTQRFNADFNKSQAWKQLEALQHSMKYSDAGKVAENFGEMMARALRDTLTPDKLPDGKLYYNIANDVVIPSLKNLNEYVQLGAKNVQTNINAYVKAPFMPLKSDFNMERAKNLIDRLTEYVTEGEDANEWLLGDDVIKNFARSSLNDAIEENASLFDDAGFTSYVTRSSNGGCCDWCESMTGTYELGKEPEDFWRMHKDCSCSIEYVPSRTKWSRITMLTESGKRTKITE